MNNQEKYIELFLNEISKSDTDYKKAKKCYAIAALMILDELDSEFMGFLSCDREEFWKKQIKKFSDD